MKTQKLIATVINQNGCNFDNAVCSSIKNAIAWAKDRGGKYWLEIYDGQEIIAQYQIKNNRAYSVKE